MVWICQMQNAWCFSDKMRYVISPASSRCAPRGSHWPYPENLQWEAHLNQILEPLKLAPFDVMEQWQSFYTSNKSYIKKNWFVQPKITHKTLRYLNCFAWGWSSTPAIRVNSPVSRKNRKNRKKLYLIVTALGMELQSNMVRVGQHWA